MDIGFKDLIVLQVGGFSWLLECYDVPYNIIRSNTLDPTEKKEKVSTTSALSSYNYRLCIAPQVKVSY